MAVAVDSLMSGGSNAVMITEQMILNRLNIESLPGLVGLTNLDFIKGECIDHED